MVSTRRSKKTAASRIKGSALLPSTTLLSNVTTLLSASEESETSTAIVTALSPSPTPSEVVSTASLSTMAKKKSQKASSAAAIENTKKTQTQAPKPAPRKRGGAVARKPPTVQRKPANGRKRFNTRSSSNDAELYKGVEHIPMMTTKPKGKKRVRAPEPVETVTVNSKGETVTKVRMLTGILYMYVGPNGRRAEFVRCK